MWAPSFNNSLRDRYQPVIIERGSAGQRSAVSSTHAIPLREFSMTRETQPAILLDTCCANLQSKFELSSSVEEAGAQRRLSPQLVQRRAISLEIQIVLSRSIARGRTHGRSRRNRVIRTHQASVADKHPRLFPYLLFSDRNENPSGPNGKLLNLRR